MHCWKNGGLFLNKPSAGLSEACHGGVKLSSVPGVVTHFIERSFSLSLFFSLAIRLLSCICLCCKSETIKMEIFCRWIDRKIGERAELILQSLRRFTYVTAHSPIFMSLHLRHSSFSNPSVALPMSQLIHQPFRCFAYVSAYSPTLLSLLLCHRLFTYVTWRAAHVIFLIITGTAVVPHLILAGVVIISDSLISISSFIQMVSIGCTCVIGFFTFRK